jgi:hypothetical protein
MKSSSKVLAAAVVMMAVAGCATAQNCISCQPVYTSCSTCCNNCFTLSSPPTKIIPDLKTAPDKLPAYKERVLLWDGEEWSIATRDSTDSSGEHWNILGTSYYGVSKKHPMWESLPPAPKDTPMCTATIDDKPKSWLPKGGMCRVEDAK